MAGVSPGARRALTVALIVVAWGGFLVAVVAGLVEGLLVVVIGFVVVWFVTSMLSSKAAVTPDGSEPSIAPDGTLESAVDVEARVRQRLEQMNKEQTPPAEGSATTPP
jgi:plastocyanin domain-containing protein